ncbi:hypothetical protein [Paraburkholderia sp.]|jgi:hypothetical protein|uniref:hypothetical protein n=1 Tax=Paraburkholderia sp. TaxID=1926495 RepID=UPI002F4291CB
MKRTWSYLIFVLVGASISLVWAVTMSNPAHLNWSTWAYSDWLINYDTGFIRRGMSGWLIQSMRGGEGDVSAVNLLVFANYASLSVLLMWTWLRSRARNPAAIALAILVPGGLFQMAIGNAFFFRKEIVFHIALGIDCILYSAIARTTVMAEARKLRAAWVLVLLFAAQSVLMPLLHEAYAFISFPAAWLIARRVAAMFPQQRALGRIVKATVLVQIVMFVVCAMFKGNPEIANQMWHTLAPADRSLISPDSPAVPTGGISAIGWSTSFNLAGVLHMFLAGQFWIWGFAGAGIAGVLVLVTLWNGRGYGLADSEMLRRHMAQLGFLFLASTPMYLLGVDWGRWLSSVTISYLLLLFVDGGASVSPPGVLQLVPQRLRRRVSGAFDFTAQDVAQSVSISTGRHRKALFLLALFFCLTFRAPECCMTLGSPFYRLKPVLEQIFR